MCLLFAIIVALAKLDNLLMLYNQPTILTIQMFKDPVCNMMVDEKKAQHISEVNGQKVYLCSSNCKSQFEQNPNKYGY